MNDNEMRDFIVETAKETFWNVCPDDFCIQYDDFPMVMVFGSVNRVVWTYLRGFKVDSGYCTDKFILNAAKQGF